MIQVTVRRVLPVVMIALVVMANAFGLPPKPKKGKTKFFIGLWQGVDILDGSTLRVSISDLDHDGILHVRYSESHFSVCFDAVDNTQGRGIYSGDATVNDDGELEIDGALVCINDDDTEETPSGVLFTGHADPSDDILAILGDAFSDPLILHRTSRK